MDNIPPQIQRPERKKKKKVNSYILFRPFISRLFTYVVLLYLASNNYELFEEQQHSYRGFLNLLEEPVITDIKLVSHNQRCPEGYNSTPSTFYPSTYSGCICDGYIFKTSQCKYLNVKTKEKCVANNMVFYDPTSERKANSQMKGSQTRNLQKENITSSSSPTGSSKPSGPTGPSGEMPNMSTTDEVACLTCYQNVPGLSEDLEIQRFYKNEKICYKLDKEQNTITYLKSASEYCDEKNLCNEFFCKPNNDQNKKCPVTTILNKNYINKWADENFKDVLGYSDSYSKFFNFDSNYHGYVYAPLTNIMIGRNGACTEDGSILISNYALSTNNDCQLGSRFSTFDSIPLNDLMITNGHREQIEKSLPYFFNYTTSENWGIVSKTAFSKETMYCIINKYLLFSENSFTLMSQGKLSVARKEEMRPEFSEKLYVYYNIHENAKFQKDVQIFILWVNLLMTIFEVLYVMIKLFNVCGDSLKCLLCLCSFEGYFAFLVDMMILITTGMSSRTLSSFVHHVEDLLDTGCLDENVFSNLTLFKVATEVMGDKNLEMFLIILMKFILITISIVYMLFSKGGKVNFRQCEQIIFEKEDDEEEEEEKKETDKDKKKQKSNKQLSYVNIEQDASKLSQRRLNDNTGMDQTNRTNNTYLEVTKRVDNTVAEPDRSENLGPNVNIELQLRNENKKIDQQEI
jgi:hypothetical protein